MAAAAVDVGHLSAFYDVPQTTLHSLLDAPTVELVQSLLGQLQTKANHVERLKADHLRTEVRLKSEARAAHKSAQTLRESVEKGLKESEELRRKLNGEENLRTQLESELQALKSSTATSVSEVQTLKTRITYLETSNREATAALDAKSTAHDKLAEELATQHQKIVALRKEASDLQEQKQSLENAAMSTRFREQSLQQEIDLLKKNNDWCESELKTRNAEYAKYRKEKGAKLSELQRLNEDANQTIESLRRTETTLRHRLDEVNQKVEDLLLRIQQLQESASKQQEASRAEIDNAKRLFELQKKSAESAKARLQEVQDQLSHLQDSAAIELGALQAEVETERTKRQTAETKIEELEFLIETAEAAAAQQQTQPPSTPRRGFHNGIGTPARAGSPAVFTPGGSKALHGKTATQLYSENTQLRADLDATRKQHDTLRKAMDEMLLELEKRQPEVDELREELQRVTDEVSQISGLLEAATTEKELAQKESRRAQGDTQAAHRECEVMRKQLVDLSVQIKLLLVEQQARAQGLESLSAAQQAYLERVARGELDEEHLSDPSSTNRLISSRLVLFRTVEELQHQNQELLRTIRGVADKYEGSEAQATAVRMEQDRQELEQLREQCAQAQDQVQSLTTRCESFVKERDMYRRMVTHRGQIPPGSDAETFFAQSVGPRATATPPPGAPSSQDHTQFAKDIADYGNLLKELQGQFDTYKEESATDRASLRQQVDRLSKEKGELQAENGRINTQLTLAHERYELLQSNFTGLKSENGDLQKRAQALQESAAKQDLRAQQVADELMEAQNLVEGLRHENANLKAERELWKRIENRITEDNRALLDERSRLNNTIADLQKMQNDREASDSENRRRLQTRIEALEAELHAVKCKLEEEQENSRKASLRREYEQDQNRTRIDDLVKTLSTTREELVQAKTVRDQLQARVDEMKIELRNAEDRAQALNHIPSARTNDTVDTNEDGLTREQELAVEVADLKQDLDRARAQIESAKVQIEDYKGIAQSTEEQLENINETAEQYREEMDRVIAEKDAKITDLDARVQDISSELEAANRELSDLRQVQEQGNSKFEQEKQILEAEISRLKDDCDRFQETAKLYQEDLKVQAEIAVQAQQSYEDELVRHGEATKQLREVREAHNTLRSEVADFKAQAEAARTSLAQNEEHWSNLRERYEREMADLRTRNDDIKNQNKIIHDQLDHMSTQLENLRHSRASVAGGEPDDAAVPSGMESLQEVIRYLRQEKDIVDVQYQLTIQEANRLRQRLDYTQSQLDETREKLDAERTIHANTAEANKSYSKLKEAIDELNTYRESAATLRYEARKAQEKLAERVKQVEELTEQMEPLRARVLELESSVEFKDGEIQLLQQDRDRWQKRTQDILTKYNRVDPAEMEALNTRIDTLQSELDQATAEKQALQSQVDGFEDRLALTKKEADEEANRTLEQGRQRTHAHFKEKSKEWTNKIKELAGQVTKLNNDLEEAQRARDDALERVNAGSSKEEMGALEARIVEAENKANEESNKAADLQAQTETFQGRIRELEAEVARLNQRIVSLEAELSQAQQQTKGAQARISVLQSRQAATEQAAEQAAEEAAEPDNLEELEQLKAELAAAQKEAEDLRTAAAIETAVRNVEASGGEADTHQLIAQEVERIKQDLEHRLAESISQAAAKYDLRAKKMREQLTAKLNQSKEKMEEERQQLNKDKESVRMELVSLEEGKTNLRRELEQTHEAAMVKLKSDHEAEIQRLKSEYEAAMEKLNSDHETMVASLKSDHTADVERLSSEHATEIQRLKSECASSISGGKQEGPRNGSDPTLSEKPLKAEELPDVFHGMETEQVRQLVKTNPIINGIVKDNIKKIVAKEKEKFEQDAAKKVEEVKDWAEKQKIANSELYEKKNALKLNMLDNRLKNEKSKLSIVEKAATETPARPVGEVWETVKAFKPGTNVKPQGSNEPAAQPPATTEADQTTPATEAKHATSPTLPATPKETVAVPTAAQAPLTAEGPNTVGAVETVPAVQGSRAVQESQPAVSQQSISAPNADQAAQALQAGQPTQEKPGFGPGFGQHGGFSQGHMFNPFAQQGQTFNQQGQPPFNQAQPFAQLGQQFGQSQGQGFGGYSSNLPQPGFTAGGQPRFGGPNNFGMGAGTGPGALRDIMGQQPSGSNIPRAGGGIPRPSGARPQGNQQTGQAGQQQGQQHQQQGRPGGQRGRGQMNPEAGQFTPSGTGAGGRGQKRGRDDGEDGGGFRGGKRNRGGRGH